MSYRAIYTYAWDIDEVGVGTAISQFTQMGLDTITIAGSYHAGKFLRPHGQAGKVYFPEDGTTYFRTDPRHYGEITPRDNSLVARHDVLGALCAHGGMAVNVWLVLLHNTALGMAHPGSVVRNAFSDPYFYNLCPAAPAARAYARGLARDVTTSYPVSGLSIEAPGFTPYAHGYHHEFALMRLNPWLENMLGLCFCEHCIARATAAGVDGERLRQRVAADITAYLDSDVDHPADMAEAFWRADIATDGDLQRYLAVRNATVTSLIAEIRADVRADIPIAIIPSVARPTGGAWYEGTDLRAIGETTGIIEACFYEPSPGRVLSDLFDIRRRIDPSVTLRGILRPSFPDIADRGAFISTVETLVGRGVTELAFYNYGHLRRHNLEWIGAALEAAR